MANTHGGRRPGAGRPRRATEERIQETIRAAFKASGLDEQSFWQVVVQKSIEGSARHAQFVLHYLYGKPTEHVRLQNDEDIVIKLGSKTIPANNHKPAQ